MKFEHQHVVSFSGGLCSYWAGKRVVQRFGAEETTLLFADTQIEDDDLYRFLGEAVADVFGWPKISPETITALRQCAARVGETVTSADGLPGRFVIIADGRTPWDVMRDERIVGNSRIDPCSKILKRELLGKWMRANSVEMAATLYLGLDWTEKHRLDRLRLRKPGWTVEAPMQWEPLWDKTRMFRELEAVGIATPRLYKMGFPHNNCGGFCIKAGQAHFAHLLHTMPERYKWHEEQETALRGVLGKGCILKESVAGETRFISLQQFRERVEAGKDFDRLEWGGCGCAVEAT